MKNWKTTLFGCVGAALVLGYKLFTHQPVTIEDVSIAVSSIGIGSAAKDHNVTGGTNPQ